jgi:hypothetical protein
MKVFKTLEEMRAYNRERARRYYARHKSDEEYKRKRREYQRKRYAEMMARLKNQE